MRIVSLDYEDNNRYEVILSREDWKKIFLEINHKISFRIVFFLVFIIGASFLFYESLFQWLNELFHYSETNVFCVAISVFIVLPVLFFYFVSFKEVLRPFKRVRGMKVDAIERKIFLKNKMFSFKDTERLVFYLGRNIEKDKKNYEKTTQNHWIYYVKRMGTPESNNRELTEDVSADDSLTEFIVDPVEIKDIVDFNLVLGKDGLLGVWRQIAELLGVNFEENIEWEEKILLSPKSNAFSYETSNGSSIMGKSSFFDNKGKIDTVLGKFLVFLKEKVKGKDVPEPNYLVLHDFGEFTVFEDELMGVRMFSSGFELRFWGGRSDFPVKKSVVNENEQIVLDNEIIKMMFLGITLLMAMEIVKDLLFKAQINIYGSLIYLVVFIYAGVVKSRGDTHSNFLARVTYLFAQIMFFILGGILVFVSFLENSSVNKLYGLVIGVLIFVIALLTILSDINDFYCYWNPPIDRYVSKLIFSFEDKILEGEYGFCVSKYQWKIPISKVRSFGLLRAEDSFIKKCLSFLVIKIEEDYIVMPFPCLEEDERREVLSFLYQAFNSLL